MCASVVCECALVCVWWACVLLCEIADVGVIVGVSVGGGVFVCMCVGVSEFENC